MKKKEGFTLIELMVVVVIVGVLSALATASYIKTKRYAEYKGALANVYALAAAAKNYYLSMGSYPWTADTAATNTLYGTRIIDSTFHEYRIQSSGSPCQIVVCYASGDGTGTDTATYIFNLNGTLSSCGGADCM